MLAVALLTVVVAGVAALVGPADARAYTGSPSIVFDNPAFANQEWSCVIGGCGVTDPDALELLNQAALAVGSKPSLQLFPDVPLSVTPVPLAYAVGPSVNRAFNVSCSVAGSCQTETVNGAYTVVTTGEWHRYAGCTGGYTSCFWGDLPAGRYAEMTINGSGPFWFPGYTCSSPCGSYADVKTALDALPVGVTYLVQNSDGSQIALFRYISDANFEALLKLSAPYVCTGSCLSGVTHSIDASIFSGNETQPATFSTEPFPTLRSVLESGLLAAQIVIAEAIDPNYTGTGTSVPPTSFGTPGGSVAANPTHSEAEPVNTATGSYYTSATDLRLGGIGVPFAFTRSYNSADTTSGPLGPGWTHEYNASLAVQPNGDVIVRTGDGQQLYLTKNPDGSFTGAAGQRAQLTSITGGYELVMHAKLHYRFDTLGHLTSVKDRYGQGLTFGYDGSGNMTAVTDSVGRAVALSYSGSLVTDVTLPDGRNVHYGYTGGLLTSVRDARGNTTQYTYDSGNRLAMMVDQNQHTLVRNVYDPTTGRVTDQYDALNNHSTFAWDPVTQTSTFTDARGKQWKDVYNNYVLTQRIDPLGDTTKYEYDTNLDLTKVTDARNNATTMTYDANSNLLTRTAPAPLSYQQTWTYNAFNDPLTYKDGRGNQTDYGYDTAGNLTSVTGPDPDGAGPLGRPVTTYGRDPAGTGLLFSIKDPKGQSTGKTTALSYDTQGNLVQSLSPLGEKTTYGYDSSGRLTSMIEPRGYASGATSADYKTTFTYDAADNQLTRTTPDPDGTGPLLAATTTRVYDPAGNLSSVTDPNGHATSYQYDSANNLTKVTAPDPDGTGPLTAPLTQYAYNADNDLATRTDANNNVTSYGYDDARRLTTVTAPLSRVWSYSYDANGNVASIVDANGNSTPASGDGTTTYSYDVLNRLTGITYSDTTPAVGFQYDPNGNRTQMTDGSGTQSFTYDTLNRLTQTVRGSDTFAYSYDIAGNLAGRTYPGQPAASYAYDDDERLQSVTASSLATTYGYDLAGNLTLVTQPSGTGVTIARTFDRDGRLTQVANKKGSTVISQFALTLDTAGNPTAVVRTGTPSTTTTYKYDGLDRITESCAQASACTGANSPFIRWTYDPVGNRLTQAQPSGSGGTLSYSYNAADQLTQAGTTTYGFDQNGNETSAGTRTFAYDLANRLKSTTASGTTTTYAYDGVGKRLQASTGAGAANTTNYLWDVTTGVPQLAVERDGGGTLLRRYLYGADHVSMSTPSATFYFEPDQLGSVANLTSSTGAAQWTYAYDAYGTTKTETKNVSSAPTNLMKFAGEQLDPTGLYYLRARQYDPTTGRFTGIDPLTAPLTATGRSVYQYADDRPTVMLDPTGMAGTKKENTCPSIWCWVKSGGPFNPHNLPPLCRAGLADTTFGTVVLIGGNAVGGGKIVLGGGEVVVGDGATVASGGWEVFTAIAGTTMGVNEVLAGLSAASAADAGAGALYKGANDACGR